LNSRQKTIDELNGKLDDRALLASSQSLVLADFEAAVHRNFDSAFDDPSRKLKYRLKKRAYKLIGRSGAEKLAPIKQANVIRRSVYFDRLWYLERHPEVARKRKDPALHYLRYGTKDHGEPGPLSSGRQYLESNPDVADSGMNPLLHYELYGRADGRALPSAIAAATLRPKPPSREHRRDVFSILYVSGEPATPGNFFRVTNYVGAAKANGVYAEWFAAAELASRLEQSRSKISISW
jgi:hypothetical protein